MALVLEFALDWLRLDWHSTWKHVATCSRSCRQLAWQHTTERMVDFARNVVHASTRPIDSGRCHEAQLPWPQELTCMWTQWYTQLGHAQLPAPWFRTVDRCGVEHWAVAVGETVRFAGWSHTQNELAARILPPVMASGYYIWCQARCTSQVVALHDTLCADNGMPCMSALVSSSIRGRAVYVRTGVTLLPLNDLTALLFMPKSLVLTQDTHLPAWVQRRLQQPAAPPQLPHLSVRAPHFRPWVPVVPRYPPCKPTATCLPYALNQALGAGVQMFLADADLVRLGRTGWGGLLGAMRCWREKATVGVRHAVAVPVQGRSYTMPPNLFPQQDGIQQFAAWYHRITPPPPPAVGPLKCGQMYDVVDEYDCWHPAVVVTLTQCAVTVRFCGWSSRMNLTIPRDRRWSGCSAPYGSRSFVVGGELHPNTYCLVPIGSRYGWAKVETLLRGRWKSRVTILVARQNRRYRVWQDHAAIGLLPLDDQTACFSAKWMGGEPYWPLSFSA
jgi:hypothetical protein